MSKTCPSCGKTHEAAERCPYCNADVPVLKAPELAPESKEVRVLKAKIKTKKDQIADMSQTGPYALIIIGILVLVFSIFMFLGFILGAILVGVGIWWSNTRTNEERRLRNEIAELEAELE